MNMKQQKFPTRINRDNINLALCVTLAIKGVFLL